MAAGGQHQFLIRVGSLAGYFDSKTGGDPTIDFTPRYNGGTDQPNLIPGRPGWSDIQVRKDFDAATDQNILKFVAQSFKQTNSLPISVTPTKGDGKTPSAAPMLYRGKIKQVVNPEADANSTAPPVWGFDFQVESQQ